MTVHGRGFHMRHSPFKKAAVVTVPTSFFVLNDGLSRFLLNDGASRIGTNAP